MLLVLPLVTVIVSEQSLWWLNYPGLELWKFLNLAIFLGVAIFILRRPLRETLVARRERIKRELLQAQKERDEALAMLAELERQRLRVATDQELEKLRHQAQREIEMAVKVARQELRRFLAERSVQVAKESVIKEMREEDDARLIGASIAELR